jgi:hypothetical protein
MGFTENITSHPITRWNEVLEEGATETARLQTRVWKFTKTVNPDPVVENGSKVLTGIAASTTSDGGASSGKKHAVIKANKSKGTTTSPSTGNKGGGSGGGGGGGGGGGSSKPAKRIERRQRKDNVPRYNELTNAIEKLTDTIEDTETAMDRLYGAKRLEAMDKLSEKLQDEIDLHKAKLDLLNKEYYAEDRQHLQDTFTLGAKDIKTDNPELYKAYQAEWDAIFAMQMEFDEESQEWVNRTEMHDMMHDLYNKVYNSWSHEGKTEE